MWWLFACVEPQPAEAPRETPSAVTGATGATGHTGVDAPGCVAAGHPLRADCAVDAAALTVTGPPGTAPRVRPITGGFRVDLLRADTEYRWQTDTGTWGVFTTGRVPDGVGATVTVDGPLGSPYVGFASPCIGVPSVVIVDATGAVVWFDDLRRLGVDSFVEGASFTDEGTVLALAEVPDEVLEIDLDGELVARWAPDVYTHHDAFRRDGLTYVLFQEIVDGYRMDGVLVYDGPTDVARWRLSEWITPRGPLQAVEDYSHANSVWVDAAGAIYVSFRHLSAVVKVAPLGAAREPLWSLVGDPDEQRLPSTLRLVGGDFFAQHNAHVRDGQLWLFDNRRESDPSRALALAIDEAAGEARVAASLPLPTHCPYQGSAWGDPAGGVLATCAPTRVGHGFSAGSAPVATLRADCAAGGASYVSRFVPLDAALRPPGYEATPR